MERSIKIFLASIRSQKTKRSYLISLDRFKKTCKFDSFDEFVSRESKQIQNIVEDYILVLREELPNPNSVPTYYYPIQTFLEMNDVMINFKKMRRMFPEQVKTAVERGWTLEEIRKMLSLADNLRTIAVIHFENASGGRIGIFEGLLMKHLVEINDEKYGKCYAIVGYAESLEEYITFLSPEATYSLDNYLDSRRNTGEKITKESPIFIKSKGTNGKIIISEPHNLGGCVYALQKKAGLRNPSEKKRRNFAVSTNHGFRYRFNEIMKSSNLINPHIAERLLSHVSKLIPLDSVYYNPKIDELFHEYKKIIPFIAIDQTEVLATQNKAIKVERSEHEALKNRIAELEKINNITKDTIPESTF